MVARSQYKKCSCTTGPASFKIWKPRALAAIHTWLDTVFTEVAVVSIASKIPSSTIARRHVVVAFVTFDLYAYFILALEQAVIIIGVVTIRTPRPIKALLARVGIG
jgi:hypothetical protein